MEIRKARFAIFDFETTGLYPYGGDRICEIGAIKAGFGLNEPKKFHRLVDPKRPLSYGACRVNGLNDEMLRGQPTITEALPEFLKFIEGCVLVAYNAGFDLGFLENELGDNRSILSNYVIIDALALARRLFPSTPRFNLGYVAETLGIDSSNTHRAMKDAFLTWKIFERELAILRETGILTVEDIAHSRKVPRIAVKNVKDCRMELIEDAIFRQAKLNIIYRSAWNNNVTKREITPITLQKGYDRTYLLAHCHMRGEERNFRVDCIIEAKPVK